MKVPHTRYRISEYFGDSDWHVVNLYSDMPLVEYNPLAPAVADLNGEWVVAGGTSAENTIINNAGSGYTVVKSNSNYNVPSSTATMYVRFSDRYEGGMVFKIMNRAEGKHDYPTVTLDDGIILYSNKANTTSFTSFTVPAGKHLMTVGFSKDGSGDSDLDRAFLAIPNEAAII
jgi:hypothetical protein